MGYKDKEKQREYLAKHYKNNKAKYHRSSQHSREKTRLEVKLLKESKPCKDCGKWYPYYVMQYDHLRDKEFQISQIHNRFGKEKIMKEIDKCDLVCSNCHCVRTHLRNEHSKWMIED